MMKWLKRGIANAVEFESTVNQAVMLGVDRGVAQDVVKRLRRETAWSWERIRVEILRHTSGGIS